MLGRPRPLQANQWHEHPRISARVSGCGLGCSQEREASVRWRPSVIAGLLHRQLVGGLAGVRLLASRPSMPDGPLVCGLESLRAGRTMSSRPSMSSGSRKRQRGLPRYALAADIRVTRARAVHEAPTAEVLGGLAVAIRNPRALCNPRTKNIFHSELCEDHAFRHDG